MSFVYECQYDSGNGVWCRLWNCRVAPANFSKFLDYMQGVCRLADRQLSGPRYRYKRLIDVPDSEIEFEFDGVRRNKARQED